MSVFKSLITPISRRAWLPFLVLGFAVTVWSVISLGPDSYSFEERRRMMAITQYMTREQWYSLGAGNWDFSCPPLNVYLSWLCGKIGSLIEPTWFALYPPRDAYRATLKTFMHICVIVSQLAFYAWPAYVWTSHQIDDPVSRIVGWAFLLIFPSLSLIDHGLLDFNSIFLGISILSFDYLARGKFNLAAGTFTAALLFEGNTWFYLPVMSAALLSHCVRPAADWKSQPLRFFSIALTIVVTSVVLLAPSYMSIVPGSFQSCVWLRELSTSVKFSEIAWSLAERISQLDVPWLRIAPSCFPAFFGEPQNFLWVLSRCAWSLFLFKRDVRLLLAPLLPTMMIAVQHHSDLNVQAMSMWITNVALFFMWGALKSEGLEGQLVAVTLLYNCLFFERGAVLPHYWLDKLVVSLSYLIILIIVSFNLGTRVLDPSVHSSMRGLEAFTTFYVSHFSFAYYSQKWLWSPSTWFTTLK